MRHRVEFAVDPVGILLWLGAWLLLGLESVVWVACWAVLRMRHTFGMPGRVGARTPGPPDRMWAWSVGGAAAAHAKVDEIADGIERGQDVAATASQREVGGQR